MNHPNDIHQDEKYLDLTDYDIEDIGGKTEKITVNVPILTLAQIDAIVDLGHFQNRAEFLRFSALKQLELYSDIDRMPWRQNMPIKPLIVVGILFMDNKTLERAKAKNNLIRILVVGILRISNDVDPQLFDTYVSQIKVWGSIKAPPEIKKLVETKRTKYLFR
ncbi:MAG: hypothetical protein ACXAD7_24990 [Candidatus Kariarchaeaceae archaeon]|jgi:Arc/MetJ-type ribon-helix-helix transcriptional regulator